MKFFFFFFPPFFGGGGGGGLNTVGLPNSLEPNLACSKVKTKKIPLFKLVSK